MSKKFESQQAPEPVGAYPHARKVGSLLFLSGVGPRERGIAPVPLVASANNRVARACSAPFQISVPDECNQSPALRSGHGNRFANFRYNLLLG